jgi:ABC-type lipoprotein export system ATPase subunit
MALIEMIDLVKHYNQGQSKVRALDGVSLGIAAGEFVSVAGRSGSGKTTMLDLCGLLMRPTSGRILIEGVDTAALSDGRRAELRGRRIGFVFQEYNLLASLNVLENVTLPLRYTGGHRAAGRRRAVELLEAVGLQDKLTTRADQLSGGQQQRVAIARALVSRPAVMLADEPTGALDTETAAEFVGLLRQLNQEEGLTVVVVTHDTDLAAQTDRVIRLRDGRVLDDARQRPHISEEVAV